MVDRSGPKGPSWSTTDWGYARLHGGRAAPSSCYGRVALATWAERLREGPSLAYVYFNNDGHGCAVRNATGAATATRGVRDRQRDPVTAEHGRWPALAARCGAPM